MKKLFLFVISMFISINVLNAECSDVKADIENVSYQLLNISSNEESKVEILVYGLTEEMYLLVSEDYDGESITYNYSDTDEGEITITSKSISSKINYTFKVYSTDKTCSTSAIKAFNVTTPRYNFVSDMEYCEGMIGKIDMCDPFYDKGDMTEAKLIKEIEASRVELDKSFGQKVWDFIKSYWLYAFIPFILIAGIYIVRIIIYKRGNKEYV